MWPHSLTIAIFPVFQKKNILAKHMFYLESALCFMESALAMERDKLFQDATKMYNDTYLFVE